MVAIAAAANKNRATDRLLVRANRRELRQMPAGQTTVRDGWLCAEVDLSPLAGESVMLEPVSQPTGWSNQAGRSASCSSIDTKKAVGKPPRD